MEEERQVSSERLVKKLKICLKTVQSLVFAVVGCVAALVIFVTVASLTGMHGSDQGSFMLGIIIICGVAALCVLGALATLVTAYIFLRKLKKLGPAENEGRAEEEN